MRYLTGVAAAALAATSVAQASRLDDALEAAADGKQFIDVSAVPAWQYALNDGEAHGNYTLDAIGVAVLAQREDDTIGNTDLIVWVNSSDKIDGLNSAPELSEKAGLLWDTTDIGGDSASTSLLVLGVEQWLFEDRLSVGVGKYFPGQFYLVSPYTADNSSTFTNKMISGNPVTGFWESIGLGFTGAWYGDGWLVQAGLVDAQADADGLDFSSFGRANYAYAAEFAWMPSNPDGMTSLSAMAYRVDSHDNIKTENGAAVQFTHEFGEQAKFAAFGRYTVKSGGTGQNANGDSSAPAVDHGGFAGFAWNRPFGRPGQLATALVYGEPTSFRDAQGFNTQFGVETYWRYQPNEYFHLTPSLQLLSNDDDELEAVIGLRAFFGFNRGWAGPILGGP